MATVNRQSKSQRKGAPNSAGRPSVWSGARASPTFSPTSTSPRPTNPASTQGPFPPLAQTNGNRSDQDRVLKSLAGLTGITITLVTKTAQRYEGVVSSTSGEGDTTGVTLKDVKEISSAGSPLKDQLFIATTNIDTWTSGPADAKLTNGDTFRTDADISQKKGISGERELQAWQAPTDVPTLTSSTQFARGDDVTFGPGSTGNISWDQFAANEELFGVKATYDESVYTTKLDRSGADYKERERKAQKIANEIIGSTTTNPHLAEERNQQVDDSGINEEDKYGAVVRGANAYIPPGARRTNPGAVPSNGVKSDIPKVSVNGPDGASVSSQTQSPASSSKTPSPAPSSNPNKPPADPLPAFRDFVTNEKQRLTQKRQALVKNEMDKRMADLVKFSQSFKLNKPIPEDLVPILAKDEEKQRLIREKSSKDASSAQARNIGASLTAHAPVRGPQITTAKIVEASRKPTAPASGTKTTSSGTGSSAATANAQKPSAATTKTDVAGKPKPAMFIQSIPPFKGHKSQASTTAQNGTATAVPPTTPATAKSPSPNSAAGNRLNVNASSFRPNPKASAFTPIAPSPGPSTSNHSMASASASPKPKEQGPTTPNPFFGTRPVKKSPPVNLKDDFNPFKHNKFVEASSVSGIWPYNGKRYLHMFPAPQHPPQQHSPHMVPPAPPPMPPPSYEEDQAAAATRGFVYYAPYYPGQPMMPGMAPPGGPGAFMPSPYMQPMPYPPGVPPNAMYGPPGMGQMPPPQAYMQPPPPPGTYPPPNGAGPRPSMPPTPIPAHAHPYYHQSPQMQHAVPYPMMMPPPNAVPHPYETAQAPPVQMGGHA